MNSIMLNIDLENILILTIKIMGLVIIGNVLIAKNLPLYQLRVKSRTFQYHKV